jgi:hypothetical protein
MWRIAERVFASERNTGILKVAMVALSKRARHEPERLEKLILPLAELPFLKRGDDPLVGLLVFFAIEFDLSGSKALLSSWIDKYPDHQPQLHSALFDLRQYIAIGFKSGDPSDNRRRNRAKAFLSVMMSSMEPAVRSWPQSGRQPTKEEIVAIKLFDEIADQIYFAIGSDKLTEELDGNLGAQVAFLNEYAPMISNLAALGTPNGVHHILSMLSSLIDADPKRCFDLISEAMLRTTGVAKYEHESLGASLFVKLIGIYLADYRDIFDDDARRRKLIDCLAVFVEAGWSEATQLFQNLPDLLQ